MEQTTLQQRIEERAGKKLLKDLYEAAKKEQSISGLLGRDLYPAKLNIREHYNSYGHPRTDIILGDEFAKTVFEKLLPQYVTDLTDEILKKMDEIDYLVNSNKELQEDLP